MQPKHISCATDFLVRTLPSRFDRGDVAIVRSSPERVSSGEMVCDRFWIAVLERGYKAAHRREGKYIKVRWWQTKGYPSCTHPNHQDTEYEFGRSDRIEVLSVLCVVRQAPELLLPGMGILQLSPYEWDAAMVAVDVVRAASERDELRVGEDELEEEGDLAPPASQSPVRSTGTAATNIAVTQRVQPICGARGEWCDLATQNTEFDVRDRYGRWYGAMVLDGHVGDCGDSVRFALQAWDGRVKAEVVMLKSGMGRDIAPAGSRLLTPVSHVKYGGRLLTPFETKALQNGTRVSVMWSVDSPTEWYEAVATKTKAQSRKPKWDAWYQLDFDAFVGMEYFDLHKLAANQQLRLADPTNKPSAAQQEGSLASAIVAAPEKLPPQKLEQMCASGDLLDRRIAGFWSDFGSHYKGTVICCDHKGFVCQYDDGEELMENSSDDCVYLLAPPPPAIEVAEDTAAAFREFGAGLELECCCAGKDGEVWLHGKVVAPIPDWPSWYRVAIKTNVSGTAAIVEKEVLLRAANEDIVWRRPGTGPRYRGDAGIHNARRGQRAFNGFQNYSVAQSLLSPTPTWGRVTSLDTCNAVSATVEPENERENGYGQGHNLEGTHARKSSAKPGTTKPPSRGCGKGKESSTLPRQALQLPDGSVCGVGDTCTVCNTHGDTTSEQCDVPIVKICNIIKATDGTGSEVAVEVQWLRRGSETYVRGSWSGSNKELFLCTERHRLSASMLGARCLVLFGTRSSVARRMRKHNVDSTVYVCHMSYDAEQVAFVDLHEVAEGQPAAAATGTKRKATSSQSSVVQVSDMDLYCGAGGLTEGLRLAGIQTLHGVESDQNAAAAWQLNNPDSTVWHSTCQDLLDRIKREEPGLPEVGSLDVLSMGPPCQGFTSLGHANPNDERNRQELQVGLAFTQHMRPKVVICENVPGLLAAQHVDSLRRFISGLVADGYQVHCQLLNAAHYGVPSTRLRLFVVGALHGCKLPRFPAPTHRRTDAAVEASGDEAQHACLPSTPTVRDALAGLPRLDAQEGHPSREMIWVGSVQADAETAGEKCGAEQRAELGDFARWCRQGAPQYLYNHTVTMVSDAASSVATLCPDLDRPAFTVLTKPSPRWFCRHPTEQTRYMSPRETARLQSFPDKLRLWGNPQAQWRQVGNAVPVLLAEALGREIVLALTGRPYSSADSNSAAAPAQKPLAKKRAASPVESLPSLPAGRQLLNRRVEIFWGGDAEWHLLRSQSTPVSPHSSLTHLSRSFDTESYDAFAIVP